MVISGSERTKLGGIEPGADVTDASNVAAAGAVMIGDILNCCLYADDFAPGIALELQLLPDMSFGAVIEHEAVIDRQWQGTVSTTLEPI